MILIVPLAGQEGFQRVTILNSKLYNFNRRSRQFYILHWLSLRPPNFVSSFFIRFTLTLTLTPEPLINRGFQPYCEGVRVKKEKLFFIQIPHLFHLPSMYKPTSELVDPRLFIAGSSTALGAITNISSPQCLSTVRENVFAR